MESYSIRDIVIIDFGRQYDSIRAAVALRVWTLFTHAHSFLHIAAMNPLHSNAIQELIHLSRTKISLGVSKSLKCKWTVIITNWDLSTWRVWGIYFNLFPSWLCIIPVDSNMIRYYFQTVVNKCSVEAWSLTSTNSIEGKCMLDSVRHGVSSIIRNEITWVCAL